MWMLMAFLQQAAFKGWLRAGDKFLDFACIDSEKGVKYLLALGPLAQLAEQGTLNPKVQGSNP